MSLIFNGTEISSGNQIMFNGSDVKKIICNGVIVWEGIVPIERLLVDFIYTDNGDDTYTITDWKGTYNGEPSSSLIIPSDPRIIL